MEKYREKVLATVVRYEGRYILIGGPCEVLEGNWMPTFPVIIEFPNRDNAIDWYDSMEYVPLKDLRMEAADANAVLFQGI